MRPPVDHAISRLVDAFHLPAQCFVNLRIPKAQLLENATFKALDKKAIREGVERADWLAVMKPTTCGVAAYESEDRTYGEIALIACYLTPNGKPMRIAELIHRAVPYPTILLTAQEGVLQLSLAHKRNSLGQGGAWVLEDSIDSASINELTDEGSFLRSLALEKQQRENLHTLYSSWHTKVLAARAAAVTGCFQPPATAEIGSALKKGLERHALLQREISTLRKAAANQRQLSRRVEINTRLQALLQEMEALKQSLNATNIDLENL